MTSREEIRTRIRGRQVPPGPPAYPKSGSVPKELSRAGVCQRPFAALQLIKDYDGTLYVSPCCLSWMEDQEFKPRVTDVSGIREFWSGPFMEDLRESVRSGSYKYCSQDRCPYLSSGNVAISLPSSVSAVPLVPAMLEYGAEVSCNLACPSCRNGPRFDNLKDPHIPESCTLNPETMCMCRRSPYGSMSSLSWHGSRPSWMQRRQHGACITHRQWR